MTNLPKKDSLKKVYQKPQVTEVKLVAEEAVLSTCKDGSGSIGAQTDCGNDGDLSCSSAGRS